jgi:hypothetical protein
MTKLEPASSPCADAAKDYPLIGGFLQKTVYSPKSPNFHHAIGVPATNVDQVRIENQSRHFFIAWWIMYQSQAICFTPEPFAIDFVEHFDVSISITTCCGKEQRLGLTLFCQLNNTPVNL